jgi:hypothetical protein
MGVFFWMDADKLPMDVAEACVLRDIQKQAGLEEEPAKPRDPRLSGMSTPTL